MGCGPSKKRVELQQELQKLREENAKLKGTIVEWRDHCRQIQDHHDHLRQEHDQLRRDLVVADKVLAEHNLFKKQIIQMLDDYNAERSRLKKRADLKTVEMALAWKKP